MPIRHKRRTPTPAQPVAAGVPPDLIRLSLGPETLDDSRWDIDQTRAKAAR